MRKKVPSFFCSQLADFVICSKKSTLRAQHFSELSENLDFQKKRAPRAGFADFQKPGFSKKARSARRILGILRKYLDF